MDDLSLVRASQPTVVEPTDAALDAARSRLLRKFERPSRSNPFASLWRMRALHPVAMSFATIVLVAVIATVSFTAFVSGVRGIREPATPPLSTETPTASPSPAPTSTAIETVDTAAWTSPPTIAFGGDCNSVFSLEQVAGFLGVPKVVATDPDVYGTASVPTRAIIEQNGGLWCMWDDGTDDDGTATGSHPVLIATVVSASVLPGSSSGIECVPNNECSFTTGADGYLLGGTIGLNEYETSTLDLETVGNAAFDAIADSFPSSTSRAGVPPAAYSQRAGDWDPDVDCTALFDSAGVWAALDRPSTPIAEPSNDGWPSQMDDLLATGHGLTTCGIGDYGDSVNVNVLPAGAWVEDDIKKVDGIAPFIVDGADRAYFASFEGEEGNSSTLWAIDGENLLVVTATAASDAKAPAAGLLRELDKDIAPATAVITTAGYGDLKLGSPVPKTTTLVKWVTTDPEQCFDHTGYWALNSDEGQILLRTDDDTRYGNLVAISVWDTPAITTKSGAHVGTSLDDLKEMFPQADVQKDGALYVVKDSLGQVVFDVGETPTSSGTIVVLIHVLLRTTTPFSAQNSGFGPCI